MALRHLPVTVIQICWIAPGPAISTSSRVSPAAIRSLGEAFQPRPRSRAGESASGSAIAPPPFSPVLFSELIERLTA